MRKRQLAYWEAAGNVTTTLLSPTVFWYSTSRTP